MHTWSGWQPTWEIMTEILSERYQILLLSGHLVPVTSVMERLELSSCVNQYSFCFSQLGFLSLPNKIPHYYREVGQVPLFSFYKV